MIRRRKYREVIRKRQSSGRKTKRTEAYQNSTAENNATDGEGKNWEQISTKRLLVDVQRCLEAKMIGGNKIWRIIQGHILLNH